MQEVFITCWNRKGNSLIFAFCSAPRGVRVGGGEYTGHPTLDHAQDEYVPGAAHADANEGRFSIFKRGMKGVYQHCGEQHLHRGLAEFEFRYSTRDTADGEPVAGFTRC